LVKSNVPLCESHSLDWVGGSTGFPSYPPLSPSSFSALPIFSLVSISA
jgi:hypothetical protein